MKEIPLTQGKIALVDDNDYKILSLIKWCYDGRYAATRFKEKKVRMHQIILNAKSNCVTDHINRNCLDNRRVNLRQISQFENTQGINEGVHFDKRKCKWCVRVRLTKNVRRRFGMYDTKEEALAVRKEVNKLAIYLRNNNN